MEIVVSYAVFYFCILILGTISGIFSERGGIVNIAINGFILFGAIMYMLFSAILNNIFYDKVGNGYTPQTISDYWQIPVTLISIGATILFTLLFGFTTIKLKSDQTISGFAINILALGIASILILVITTNKNLFPMQDATVSIKGRNELAYDTSIGTYGNILSFKSIVTIVVVAISWFTLNKTRWGLRFRAIGENPQAADVAGVNVNKLKWQGIIIAGAIAGLAGTFFAQGFASTISSTKDVAGLGYLALAIMITSRWKIAISVVVSAFFAFLYSLSFYASGILPSKILPYFDLFKAFPYFITLLIMVFTSKTAVGPAAAGIPYDKSKR
ncbi:ABC transporter permease [Mycoplasma sp. Pen4]|uniref:ABC transporter permease n=1 Tax=Mycoplasma sp. Pen4 TaxID=640330 RepID=UPI0016547308|nr:ABC transporter permease [Mycoplasma sp. Pen4]QNM93533.1 ABC transporter permease [Mycoplasma sp. Pen4]